MTRYQIPASPIPGIRITGMHEPPEAIGGIILPQQTHSCRVAEVTAADAAGIAAGHTSPEQRFPATDALITLIPDVYIGVRTADCVPILLYAPDIRAVAAIHAGWRGTLGDIAGATVRRLAAMGAEPALTTAHIAPCICAGCYEVSGDLADKFIQAGLGCDVISHEKGQPHIDLRECNRLRLCDAGIRNSNISISPDCTRHTMSNPAGYRYYSYRRIPGETGRNISAICLAEHEPYC